MATGSIPIVDVDLYQKGIDAYVYDVSFVGLYWQHVTAIAINVFRDGFCAENASHVVGGMNCGISASTMVDGGGHLPTNAYALERIIEENIDV
eukprot:9951450-Ditylum_brightwellii.AAC.1